MTLFALLFAACGDARVTLRPMPDDGLDSEPATGDSADTGQIDTGDSADTGRDSADTGETDTAETGEPIDTTDTASDTGDTAEDTADSGDEPTDSGSEDTADTATDTAPPAPSAPSLDALGVTEAGDVLVVSVTASDLDGDLDGGVITLDVDGVVTAYAISSGVTTWDGATATVELPFSACEHGDTWAISATVADVSGLSSATSTTAATISGTSYRFAESGDTPSDALNLGTVTAGTYICGDIDRAVGHKFYIGSDLDYVSFQVDTSGTWTMRVTWDDATADEDLYVYDTSGAEMGFAEDHTAAQPESLTMSLTSGTDYYAWVGGWALPATNYVLEIE